MAKLRGKKKAEFLERMARGRAKSKRKTNPKRKRTFTGTSADMGGSGKILKQRTKRFRGTDKTAAKRFADKLERQGLKPKIIDDFFNGGHQVVWTPKKANPNARRTKKAIGKGFGKQLAAEHTRSRKKAAKGSRRRNSDDMAAAERKYEEFHGRPATRVIDYETTYRYPEHFAEMGKLVELKFHLDKLNPEFSLVKFKGTQAVCTPDGANIYFIGGDQAVDFEALNIASDKDFVELGPCKYICYDTVKGFHDFQQTDYWHLFGEEDNIFPVLVYDRLNKSLFLVGGNYRVRPEGIVN
jgi:hypothetical protein